MHILFGWRAIREKSIFRVTSEKSYLIDNRDGTWDRRIWAERELKLPGSIWTNFLNFFDFLASCVTKFFSWWSNPRACRANFWRSVSPILKEFHKYISWIDLETYQFFPILTTWCCVFNVDKIQNRAISYLNHETAPFSFKLWNGAISL